MVGTAQAFAILSAEVPDEVRCPWDTKPEMLPTGTTLSFSSLAPLQGFSPPETGSLGCPGSSPPLHSQVSHSGIIFLPPEKTQTPFASPDKGEVMLLPRPIWRLIRGRTDYIQLRTLCRLLAQMTQ